MIYFLCSIYKWTLTLLTAESSSVVYCNIVEEARRDNPVEAFTERGVREYKDY